jgi:hypothetical protein
VCCIHRLNPQPLAATYQRQLLSRHGMPKSQQQACGSCSQGAGLSSLARWVFSTTIFGNSRGPLGERGRLLAPILGVAGNNDLPNWRFEAPNLLRPLTTIDRPINCRSTNGTWRAVLTVWAGAGCVLNVPIAVWQELPFGDLPAKDSFFRKLLTRRYSVEESYVCIRRNIAGEYPI